MDESQAQHLKAYGVAYRAVASGLEIKWLLNYRGGSFLIPEDKDVLSDLAYTGVTYEEIDDSQLQQIRNIIANHNMEEITLKKAPRIAVYAPPGHRPWDDAVTLVLDFAEIPYDRIYDKEVLSGKLSQYDWLHLHHEDFTGQFGKFYASYGNTAWYVEMVASENRHAKELGFDSVADLKKEVAWRIRNYVLDGGFLFAMCAATDTLDIALASHSTDIVPEIFDGTPVDPDYKKKLDYSVTFFFKNFDIITNPMIYEFSNIDINPSDPSYKEKPYFELFEFSAKADPIPTLLTQDHTRIIKEFLGQTTAFNRDLIKPSAIILGFTPGTKRVKYLFRAYGNGNVSFLGGHDPEDYAHYVGDPPTNLELYPNSPGYRLILNNILFPSARKLKRKT